MGALALLLCDQPARERMGASIATEVNLARFPETIATLLKITDGHPPTGWHVLVLCADIAEAQVLRHRPRLSGWLIRVLEQSRFVGWCQGKSSSVINRLVAGCARLHTLSATNERPTCECVEFCHERVLAALWLQCWVCNTRAGCLEFPRMCLVANCLAGRHNGRRWLGMPLRVIADAAPEDKHRVKA